MKHLLAIAITTIIMIQTSFALQYQGFSTFQEQGSNISFSCQQQCIVVLGSIKDIDYVHIAGTSQGMANIGYGFVINNTQVVGGEEALHVITPKLDQTFLITQSRIYSQLPIDNTQVAILIQGSVSMQNATLEFGTESALTKFMQGFSEAFAYRSYNPRTINFLEGPTRNGEYINQHFFRRIIGFLAVCLVGYYNTRKSDRQKRILRGGGVLVFFWVFFDLLHTVNQVKIMNHTTSANDIMQNGRLGEGSDYYGFLQFIKNNTIEGKSAFYMAPYPFDFEGRYHNYPHNRIGTITGADYIIRYNPYGLSAPFGFKDPVISGEVLMRNGETLHVQQSIKWITPYAKIYIIQH